jgi:uncharacterized protein YegP (UPF0339 family)
MYFEIELDARSEWRWRLRAANHRIVADSGEGYKNQRDCINGIMLVKGTATIPVRRVGKRSPQELAGALLRA